MSYNEIRDLTVERLECVCHIVVIEPLLQLLMGKNVVTATAYKQDNVRADEHVCGFWGCCQSDVLMQGFFILMHEATTTPVSLLYIGVMR